MEEAPQKTKPLRLQMRGEALETNPKITWHRNKPVKPQAMAALGLKWFFLDEGKVRARIFPEELFE